MRYHPKNLLFPAFAVFMVVIIMNANQRGTPGVLTFLHHIPHFDKLGHFILMGILAFLALQFFMPRMKEPPRPAMRKILGILLVLVALEEASQAFIPSRTFSIPDYLFSIAGVVTAGFFYRIPVKTPAP